MDTKVEASGWRAGSSHGALLRRVMMVAGAALLIATGSWVLAGPRPAPAQDVASEPVGGLDVVGGAATALDGGGTDGMLDPDGRVAFWEARIAAREADGLVAGAIDLLHVTDAYLDRARLSGDTADLTRAAAALDRADGRVVDPIAVESRRALVALGYHDFSAALALGERILAERSNHPVALGIVGDAQLELGRIDQARAAYERLSEVAPSSPAWSRQARLSFLVGDLDTAVMLIERALAEARDVGSSESVAFYQFQLGELHRLTGRAPEAGDMFEAALAEVDDYVPAMLGLAHVRAALGDLDEAIVLTERAAAAVPQLGTVAFLGDLYAARGNADAAEVQYELVDRIHEVDVANGSAIDRQWVLFAADHHRRLDEATRIARAEIAERIDVYGRDALAWALFRSGDADGAWVEAQAAIQLGTPDARIALHAGMIAAARGDPAVARRLLDTALAAPAALSPLLVTEAQAVLASLRAP